VALRWLVRAFPRGWRNRYGDQLTDLLHEIEKETGRVGVSDRLDVARAGLAERLVPVGRAQRRRWIVAACGVTAAVAVAGAAAGLGAVSSTSRPRVASTTTTARANAGDGSTRGTSRTGTIGTAPQHAAAQAAAAAAALAQQQAAQQAAAQAAAAAAQRAAAQAAADAEAQAAAG
jgi:hypothetical protein